MISKKKSKSSNRWLREHFQDCYVKKAQINNIRSRAWFKLEEIDCSNKLFKSGMNILDLGAFPGSWSQYARNKIGKQGRIVACDILPMKPIPGIDFFQGDIRTKDTLNLLSEYLKPVRFHMVISDMAPNITGNAIIDMPNIIHLCQLALTISKLVLYQNGIFLVKSFQGEGFNKFYKEIKMQFSQVKICKPKTSRTRSREIFILASK